MSTGSSAKNISGHPSVYDLFASSTLCSVPVLSAILLCFRICDKKGNVICRLHNVICCLRLLLLPTSERCSSLWITIWKWFMTGHHPGRSVRWWMSHMPAREGQGAAEIVWENAFCFYWRIIGFQKQNTKEHLMQCVNNWSPKFVLVAILRISGPELLFGRS